MGEMQENQELKVIEENKVSIIETAKSIQITNDEENEVASNLLKQIKSITKNIKEYWKPSKDSAKKVHTELCNKENEMLNPLEMAESEIKNKMSNYILIQEEKARKEQEAIRKAQEEEALRQLQEAENLKAQGNEIEAEIVENTAYAIDDMKTEIKPAIEKQSGISYQVDYEILIEDRKKVPVEMCGVEIRPVDTALIKKLVKINKGNIEIDGVKIIEKKIIKVRS